MIEALIVSNIALWLVCIGLGVLVFALMRQIGVLHDRLAPAGALSLSGGLKPGERLPEMRLESLSGGEVSLGDQAEDGRATLLAFISPNCPVCAELTEPLKAIARQERDWLRVVFASDGEDQPAHRAAIARYGLEGYPYLLSRDLGMRLEVSKLPYVALVDEHGVLRAKGLANSREHVESLLTAMEEGVGTLQAYLARREGAA